MNDMAYYLKTLAALFLFLAVVLAGTNYVVDPAGIYRAVELQGFNRIKPKLSTYRILWKTAYMEQHRPQLLMLGNSRVEVGFNPVSEVARQVIPEQMTRYNGAVYATAMYGVMRYMQHAVATGAGSEHILIGVDYIMFRKTRKIDEAENYAPYETLFATTARGEPQPFHRLEMMSRTLFALDAFSASLQTIQRQGAEDAVESEFGQSLNSKLDQKILSRSSPRKYFLKEDYGWIDGYLDVGRIDYDYTQGMQYLNTLFDLARSKNIRLTLFTTPTHAHIQYLESELDPERYLDQWKKALVATVASNNAQHPGQPPIEVWDFSLVNDMTAEEIPDEQHDVLMKWYIDPSHFRESLGDLVMQVLFTGQSIQTPAGETFGYRLTPDTVDDINRLHHESILRWQQRQPDDYHAFMARIGEKRIEHAVRVKGQ